MKSLWKRFLARLEHPGALWIMAVYVAAISAIVPLPVEPALLVITLTNPAKPRFVFLITIIATAVGGAAGYFSCGALRVLNWHAGRAGHRRVRIRGGVPLGGAAAAASALRHRGRIAARAVHLVFERVRPRPRDPLRDRHLDRRCGTAFGPPQHRIID